MRPLKFKDLTSNNTKIHLPFSYGTINLEVYCIYKAIKCDSNLLCTFDQVYFLAATKEYLIKSAK